MPRVFKKLRYQVLTFSESTYEVFIHSLSRCKIYILFCLVVPSKIKMTSKYIVKVGQGEPLQDCQRFFFYKIKPIDF